MAKLGKTVRYIHQENAGPSAARNQGIEAATGSFIAFLDADDTWTHDKIAEQMAVFSGQPEVGLIASDMAETGMDGTILTPSVLAAHHLLDFFLDLNGRPVPQALGRLVEKNFIPTGTVIAKKHLLQKMGGFRQDIRYGEDLELWARIAAFSPIVCLPRVHMLRRRHGANATQATGSMLRDLVKVMSNLREYCGSELRIQGVDPDKIVAGAFFDLAYWHFTLGDLVSARVAFTNSHACKPSLKTAVYAAACSLPAPMVRAMRKAKQVMNNQNP